MNPKGGIEYRIRDCPHWVKKGLAATNEPQWVISLRSGTGVRVDPNPNPTSHGRHGLIRGLTPPGVLLASRLPPT